MAHETVHTSSDAQYEATPPGAGYEHTDANVWIIAKLVFWLVVAAALIHIGLAVLFNLFVSQHVERGAPRFPLAVGEAPRLPPEPRLQRFPREDITTFRLGEENLLRSYGVDRTTGAVHIPIEEAMRLMLERKLLVSKPRDPQATEPGMPADSSAGRLVGR